MSNILDLSDEAINEDGFLFSLKKAFDSGVEVIGVKINSQTAINLHQSPAIEWDTEDGRYFYLSPFGRVAIIPWPALDILPDPEETPGE